MRLDATRGLFPTALQADVMSDSKSLRAALCSADYTISLSFDFSSLSVSTVLALERITSSLPNLFMKTGYKQELLTGRAPQLSVNDLSSHNSYS
jgi:hypothetical protein